MTRIDRWCNNITDAIVVLGLLCLLLGICAKCSAQSYTVDYNCGTCTPQNDTTEWKPASNADDWVYDEPTILNPQIYTYAVWCPCCCPRTTIYKEQRISRSTLVKQERTVTHSYKYTEREETEFAKLEKQRNGTNK